MDDKVASKSESVPRNTDPEAIWAELLYTLPYGRCSRSDCACLRFEVDPAHFMPNAPTCTVCEHHQGFHHLGTDADRTYGMRRRQNLVKYHLCLKQIPSSIEAPTTSATSTGHRSNARTGPIMLITERQAQTDDNGPPIEAMSRIQVQEDDSSTDTNSDVTADAQDKQGAAKPRNAASHAPSLASMKSASAARLSVPVQKATSPMPSAGGIASKSRLGQSPESLQMLSKTPASGRLSGNSRTASKEQEINALELGAEQRELLADSPSPPPEHVQTAAKPKNFMNMPFRPPKYPSESSSMKARDDLHTGMQHTSMYAKPSGRVASRPGPELHPEIAAPADKEEKHNDNDDDDDEKDKEAGDGDEIERDENEDEDERPLVQIWMPEKPAKANGGESGAPEKPVPWWLEESSASSDHLEDGEIQPADRPWLNDSESPEASGHPEASRSTTNSVYGRPDDEARSTGQDHSHGQQLASVRSNDATVATSRHRDDRYHQTTTTTATKAVVTASSIPKTRAEERWRQERIGFGPEATAYRHEYHERHGRWPKETTQERADRRRRARQMADGGSLSSSWRMGQTAASVQGTPGSGSDKTKRRKETRNRAKARSMIFGESSVPEPEKSSIDDFDNNKNISLKGKHPTLTVKPEVSLIDI